MEYVVYYACPHCRKPCSPPMEEGNEIVEAQNKGEAFKIFQANKPCRWMRVSRIEKHDDRRPNRYKVSYEYLQEDGRWTHAEVNSCGNGFSFSEAIEITVQIASRSARDVRGITVEPVDD